MTMMVKLSGSRTRSFASHYCCRDQGGGRKDIPVSSRQYVCIVSSYFSKPPPVYNMISPVRISNRNSSSSPWTQTSPIHDDPSILCSVVVRTAVCSDTASCITQCVKTRVTDLISLVRRICQTDRRPGGPYHLHHLARARCSMIFARSFRGG